MRLRAAIFFALALTSVAAAAAIQPAMLQQSTVQARASVAGKVVSADTGQPIAGARVTVSVMPAVSTPGTAPPPSRQATTGADGRFEFIGLTDGRLNLSAVADGYLVTLYRPGLQSMPPQIRGGQELTGITLALPRAAMISGAIRDSDGRPVSNIEVKVYRRGILTVRRAWLDVRTRVETDSEGRFVAKNLQPGEYVVSVPVLATHIPASVVEAVRAVPRAQLEVSDVGRSLIASRAPVPGPDFEVGAVDGVLMMRGLVNRAAPPPIGATSTAAHVYRTTYFPGATTLDSAEIIAVQSGDHREGAHITLQRAPGFTVSGALRRDGSGVAFIGVHLVAEDAAERSIDLDGLTAWTVTEAGGAFSFRNVPPGNYSVKVVVAPPVPGQGNPVLPPASRVTAWASEPVRVVDGNIELGSISLRPPVTISGRVEFSGAGAMLPAATGKSTVWLAAADGGMYSPPSAVPVGPDGTFVLKGAMRSRYHLWGGSYPGWSVVSVTAAGADITSNALVVGDRDIDDVRILLTSRLVMLNGFVADAAEMPVAGAEVLVFPASYAAWIQNGLSNRVVKRVRTDPSGNFSTAGLPPGLYLVAALPEGSASDYPDRRLFEAAAKSARPVALAEGKPVSVRLTIGSR